MLCLDLKFLLLQGQIMKYEKCGYIMLKDMLEHQYLNT